MDNFKVYPYKVIVGAGSPTLIDVIKTIQKDAIPNRVRKTKFAEIRADDIIVKDNLILIDFTKFRASHGPGKASLDKPIAGFEFQPGEQFAEETALLYDPQTEFIFIQYNHHGARLGAISEYINIYMHPTHTSIHFLPKLDHDIERRLQSKKIIKSVEVSVSPYVLQSTDSDIPVSQAISMLQQSLGPNKININLSAGKGRHNSLNISKVKDVVDWVRSKIDHVSVAKIRAKDDLDSEIELIDLVAERICSTQQISIGPDLRWPRDSRYNCLLNARQYLASHLT